MRMTTLVGVSSITYSKGVLVLGDLQYSYDVVGRRTRVSGSLAQTALPGVIATASLNANNQLTAWSGSALTYDANGNLLSDGSRNFAWDTRNRLASISGTFSMSFQYDPTGRRVSKTVGGVTTAFLYDRLNPVQELSGVTPVANILTGLGVDEYVLRQDSAGTREILSDALGSTIGLADSTGAVTTTYAYEPYGKVVSSGAASSNSASYTGRESDSASLLYYRARYYDAGIQRFISEDPIGLSGGMNLYRYAAGSPTNARDPLGLSEECVTLGSITIPATRKL